MSYRSNSVCQASNATTHQRARTPLSIVTSQDQQQKTNTTWPVPLSAKEYKPTPRQLLHAKKACSNCGRLTVKATRPYCKGCGCTKFDPFAKQDPPPPAAYVTTPIPIPCDNDCVRNNGVAKTTEQQLQPQPDSPVSGLSQAMARVSFKHNLDSQPAFMPPDADTDFDSVTGDTHATETDNAEGATSFATRPPVSPKRRVTSLNIDPVFPASPLLDLDNSFPTPLALSDMLRFTGVLGKGAYSTVSSIVELVIAITLLSFFAAWVSLLKGV